MTSMPAGSYDPYSALHQDKKEDPNAGKSFQELLKEKRLKAEADIAKAPPKEERKGPSEEDKAARKARLQAIREQQL
jgi:hypothetical protein